MIVTSILRKTIIAQPTKGFPVALMKFCNKASSEKDETYFGFEKVSQEEKRHRVNQVFSNVAGRYDIMNDIMSIGIHRIWKKLFIDMLDPLPGTQMLDVAGGTGDVAFEFIRRLRKQYPNEHSFKVTVCDINQDMLDEGQKKAESLHMNDPNSIEWVLGDAQNLPFQDNSFDAYTVAFGIRNVVDIKKALQESYRVLKPGGIFMCMEFSKVKTPGLSDIYEWYSFNIIPVMGELIAGDWRSYQYLVESIRQFPDQKDFADMIADTGYNLVDYKNLTLGVAAIHWGYKRDR